MNNFQHLLLTVVVVFLICNGCQQNQDLTTGKIVRIITDSNSYSKGDNILVRVEIANPSDQQMEYVVVVNIANNISTIYDTHRGSTSEEHVDDYCQIANLKPLEKKTIGPFTYRVGHEVPHGEYVVVVGLKKYPWKEIEYQGAQWCPPIYTISIQ